jgi:hypothetical protein
MNIPSTKAEGFTREQLALLPSATDSQTQYVARPSIPRVTSF